MQANRYNTFSLWTWLSLFLGFQSVTHPITTYAFSQPPILSNPSACGLNLPINDQVCNTFQINILTAPGVSMGTDIYLKEVRFIIEHEWVADLDMTLRAPSGVVVELSTDNGGGNDNYGNPANGLCNQFTTLVSTVSLDACQTPSIAGGHAPFIGSYLPEGSLAAFNDGSSPLGLWTLEICDDGKEHFGTLEFVELVFEAVICLPPSQVSVTYYDSTSAVLQWTPGGNCANTIIEFGLTGHTPGNDLTPGPGGTVIFADCPPFLLTGLTPGTTFDILLRENCNGNQFSINTCPLSLTTECSPDVISLVENFNNQPLCETTCGVACAVTGTWSNANYDDFDWIINEGATTTAQTGPSDDFPGGGRYAYIETSGNACRNGKTAYLVSNCIRVRANPDSCDLSFNYIMYGVHVNSLALEITTNGGVSWQPLWFKSGNQGDRWHKKFVDLDAFDGQTVQFRFSGKGGNGIRGDIAVDNIVFYGSEDLGAPPFIYYADADGDGFGQPDRFLKSCHSGLNLPGYVSNYDDCDDANPNRNPNAPEIPCDGLDYNCNGLDDDFDLPAPFGISDTICSEALAFVTAIPNFNGDILWYDAPLGGNFLHLGNTYFPPSLPANNSPAPVSYVFYAEEINVFGCASSSRTPVEILVLPHPDLQVEMAPEVCAGVAIDLYSVDITDLNGTNGIFTFYDGPDFSQANVISQAVFPQTSTVYYVQSKAASGCVDTAAIYVNILPTPDAYIFGDSTVCLNSTQMLLAADVGNGQQPLLYEWNNDVNTPTQNVASHPVKDSSNLFIVKITGANGCFDTDSLKVKTISSINSVTSMVQPVSTCNGSNGSITLVPLSGLAPFTYTWDDNDTTTMGQFTLHHLSQGTYAFTITDGSEDACPFVVPAIVVNGPAAVTVIQSITPVSCSGGNDGCIEINVIGSNPSILWSNGATTELNCGLTAGSHSVTVTEGVCATVLTIPVSQPAPLVSTASITDVSCPGGHDGRINLNVFGGTPPYQFAWSNGLSTQNIGNLSSGPHSVTVTDARSCEVILVNISVKQPSPMAAASVLFLPSCFGSQDGEINLSLVGGTPPYDYDWSNGAMGSQVKNLAAGAYTVSVYDVRECPFVQSFNLPQPAPLTLTIDDVKDPDCKGQTSGYILTTPGGGNGNYHFTWSNGATVEDLTGIPEGEYVSTLTDQKGCTVRSDTLVLAGKEDFSVSVLKKNTTCFGINDGELTASVLAGGEAPFHFEWNTGDEGPQLQNLSAGEYMLTITDNDGCQFDTLVVLPKVVNMSAEVTAINPACHGAPNGQISITVTNGQAPFSYHWSNDSDDDMIAGLKAANYAVTLTDAEGCLLIVRDILITDPPLLEIFVDDVESIACHGGNEGSIDVTVSGGTAPYQFQWSNGSIAEDLSGLIAGDYSLTVTDAKGCPATTLAQTIASPAPLHPEADYQEPDNCAAVPVDSVCVRVSGGLAPYRLLWNTGDTTACLFDPAVGDYVVTITDAVGCTAELMSIKVQEYVPSLVVNPAPDASDFENCAGNADAFLTVVIDGGLKPYQFIWSNGAMGSTFSDTLVNGALSGSLFYNVTITDNKGCVAVSEWMPVVTYPPLSPTIPGAQVQNVFCKGGENGALLLEIEGGKPPYQIQWFNGQGALLATTPQLQNVIAGTYAALVEDALGCTAQQTGEVGEPAFSLSVNPVITPPACFGDEDGCIDLTPFGGMPNYSFQWSHGPTVEDVCDLPAGLYSLTVTDANNCSLILENLAVTAPEFPLTLANATVTDVQCYGGSNGAIDITMAGGVPPYFYTWGLMSMEEDLDELPAGTYPLTVFDSNFCAFDTLFGVLQPDTILLAFTVTHASNGQSNGSASVNADGGNPPFTYLWNNERTSAVNDGIPAGWYSVTATDASGCEAIGWIEVQNSSAVMDHRWVASFSVAPNPASETLWLTVETTRPIPFEILLLDAIGREALRVPVPADAAPPYAADISSLLPGAYRLLLRYEGIPVATQQVLVIRN